MRHVVGGELWAHPDKLTSQCSRHEVAVSNVQCCAKALVRMLLHHQGGVLLAPNLFTATPNIQRTSVGTRSYTTKFGMSGKI